jgi:hypothetical protein
LPSLTANHCSTSLSDCKRRYTTLSGFTRASLLFILMQKK